MQQLKSAVKPPGRCHLMNVKMTAWELEHAKLLAKQHNCSLSIWIRESCLKWRPTKADLVSVDETDPAAPMTLPEAKELRDRMQRNLERRKTLAYERKLKAKKRKTKAKTPA